MDDKHATVLCGEHFENRQKIEEINLQLAQEQYKEQIEAFTAVETKASYLLIVLSAIIAAFTLSNLSFEVDNLFIRIIHFILISVIAILLFLTFIFVLKVVISREVIRLKLDRLNVKQKDDYSLHLKETREIVVKCIKNNENVLKNKHYFFKLSCHLLIVAVLAFIFDFLFIFIASLLI